MGIWEIVMLIISGLMLAYCAACVVFRLIGTDDSSDWIRFLFAADDSWIQEPEQEESEEEQPEIALSETHELPSEMPLEKPKVELHVHGAMRSLSREARLNPSLIRDPRDDQRPALRGDASWFVVRGPRDEEIQVQEKIEDEPVDIIVDVINEETPAKKIKKISKPSPWWKLAAISVFMVAITRGFFIFAGYFLIYSEQPPFFEYLLDVISRWDSPWESPLFSALCSGADLLIHNSAVSSFVLSALFAAISPVVLYYLLKHEGDSREDGMLFLIFAPLLAGQLMPSCAPLFVALSLFSILMVRKGFLLPACIAGGLSAAVLPHGILILIPIVKDVLVNIRQDDEKDRKNLLKLCYPLLIPAGLACYLFAGTEDYIAIFREIDPSIFSTGLLLAGLALLCISAKRISLSYLIYGMAFLVILVIPVTKAPILAGTVFVLYISEAIVFRSLFLRGLALAASAQFVFAAYLILGSFIP